MVLEKLDARHRLNTIYSHRVRYYTSLEESVEYLKAKFWLTEFYGMGVESNLVWVSHFIPEVNTEWAFHTDGNSNFIYLRDALVTHFSLKYLNT